MKFNAVELKFSSGMNIKTMAIANIRRDIPQKIAPGMAARMARTKRTYFTGLEASLANDYQSKAFHHINGVQRV